MKVLIADDHAIVREGLEAIFARMPGVSLVGTAADGYEAVALARQHRPDVVFMDVTMPRLNGIVATRQIRSELPAAKVIGLSMHTDPRYVIAMFKAGASGYVLKDSASDALLQAIDAVANDRTYVDGMVAGTVVDALAKDEPATQRVQLSNRENEVLQLVAEGLTSKELASRLNIAPATAESHRRQIMSKLNLRTVAELTKFAIREGLTTVEK